MKRNLIFMNGEFTEITTMGIKFLTIAFIAENGKELYLELECSRINMSLWAEENVLPIMNGNMITEEKAKQKIIEFIKENYGEDKPVLVADVNQLLWNGICTLFDNTNPFFHIPIDFSTILFTKNIDIDVDRIQLAKDLGVNTKGFKENNALIDTRVLKACWDKLQK